MKPQHVVATQNAIKLIEKLKAQYGKLIFHQSGGCCDGSVPLCCEECDFKVGSGDVLLGEIDGVPFYIHTKQLEYYKHTQLIIDAKAGNGSEYSLEYGSGEMFCLELRLFSEVELKLLYP